MSVSSTFASPARKQDAPNNNKQRQPHDKWCPSETTTSHEDYRSVKTGNMDRDPQKNLPPVSNNYGSQYNWFSPLRDIQHDTFNPTPASYPEDDPIPSMDPELSIERVPITSSRENTSTYTGYTTQYRWPNPLRDIQPGIFTSEPAPNPDDNPIFGIDPELFTERATHSSVSTGQSTHANHQHQNEQVVNRPFSWPTTSTAGNNQPCNITPLHTDTRWPAYQGQSAQNTEANRKTPSTNAAHPDTEYRLDPLHHGHGSNEQQTHRHSYADQHTGGASSIGSTSTHSEIDKGHSNPRKRETQHTLHPHDPQFRTSISHSHSNSARYGDTTPTTNINTQSTSDELGAHSNPQTYHDQRSQYANSTPNIKGAIANYKGNREQHDPREKTSQTDETPHTIQYRITLPHSSPNIVTHNTPISNPSTSTKFESHSSQKNTASQRAKGNRSPIRFPTPEPDTPPTFSNRERDASNQSLYLEQTDRININQSNLHIPINKTKLTQAEPVTTDQLPRRSYSHNSTETPKYKSKAQGLSFTLDNRHQVYQQQDRNQYSGPRMNNFTTIMADNIQQLIQNVRGQSNPKKSIRRHDAKGVSNFHLDQYDQIVRTHDNHPRCNYCFVASHPRTRCNFRKQDLQQGIDRAVHPEKGLLSYKNAQKTYIPEPILSYKNAQKLYIPEPEVTTLEQLPNEILEKICDHLTFKERCKLGATNRRLQFVLTANKFWTTISIPNQILKYELINKLVNMGTQSLSIPWSSINGEWTEYSHLISTLSTYASNLRYLNISGFNDSTQTRGDDRIMAVLVAKSVHLKTLDLTASKLTLLSTIAKVIPYGHQLTSLNLSVVGNNNHHNFLLRYETIKKIVDRLTRLKNIILTGTNLCRKSIAYVCTYLAETTEKVTLATERVRDSDIRALTNRCPNITFLNVTETLVSLEVFHEIAATWRETIRYLSLPKRVATELDLNGERVTNFQYLEELPLLWRQNVINPRDTPILAILAQFKTTVDSMSALRYMNIGNYSGNSFDDDAITKHTLQRLFKNITINLSPYDDQYPVKEDPCSVFQEGWIMNTDIESNPSLSPTSTASTIPTEDIDI